MSPVVSYILVAVAAYLIGSVSVGIVVSKLFNGPDLHKVGSGSPGASNVLRTMGWKYGLITFLGDYLKAIAACWIGRLLTGDHLGALLCGLLVILGHNWPVFFQFKGGKGVASSCGVMVFCFPIPALIGYAAAIAIIALTKFISLGSMSMLTLYAILVICLKAQGNIWIILWAAALALLCILRHRTNIQRLLHGTENKFGQKVTK